MKTVLQNIFFLLFALCAAGQKQRLADDTSRFLCKNDSVELCMHGDLKKQSVDTVIRILYDYDNGRLDSSMRVILWCQKNHSCARVIVGCNRILRDTTYDVDLTKIIGYIKNVKIPGQELRIKNDSGQSHDTGYYIEIDVPGKSVAFSVRDNALIRSPEHIIGGFDVRLVLTNMLRELIH